MTITFLLPSPAKLPAGGYKIILEYANLLVLDGFKVNIVDAGSLFFNKKSAWHKFTGSMRYFQKQLQGFSSKQWFNLHSKVKEVLSLSLNFRHVPKSDIYVASTPITAMYLNDYPIPSKQKFYFIQGYENWGGISDEDLRKTYRFDMNKIAVSHWLCDIIKQENTKCHIVPNGFDFKTFYYKTPINERPSHNVAIVYSPIACKGFRYGWEALLKVKNKVPELSVEMFGTNPPPQNLPQWIHYYKCPDKDTINNIYNNAAVFVASSIQEGWGLTVGEAMICGAAIACTDNPGYLEMATDGETALVSPISDSERLASNIYKLITDYNLREQIARNGNMHIQNFTIETSYQKLKKIFTEFKTGII